MHTSDQSLTNFTRLLHERYDTFRHAGFPERHFTPSSLLTILRTIVDDSGGGTFMHQAGTSFEGRPIMLVTAGTGPVHVLLWTQMHGDEPTATAAVADILTCCSNWKTDGGIRKILESLTLHFLPMLNPDGSERIQRRTAQIIDMNRDALELVTPEARLLRQLQHQLQPLYGFNLHDQELSTVGTSTNITAIALLAPAFDATKSDNDVRVRAKHMASTFASAMNLFIPHNLARYDDTFEPRAFGDNMQRWGTSTLLVESGHALHDARKDSIRKLNVVGILTTLFAIANDELSTAGIRTYEDLPLNGKRAYDVILRNMSIVHQDGRTTTTDLAVSYQVDTHAEATPKLVDVGDLHTYVGLEEIDAKGTTVPSASLALGTTFDWRSVVARS